VKILINVFFSAPYGVLLASFFSHLLGDYADSGDPLMQTRAVVPGIGHARSFGVARSDCYAAVLVLHV